MATAVECGVIACCYFFGGVFEAGSFFWYDYLLAVVWFIVNFVFFFRSKLYWNLGKKTRLRPDRAERLRGWTRRLTERARNVTGAFSSFSNIRYLGFFARLAFSMILSFDGIRWVSCS